MPEEVKTYLEHDNLQHQPVPLLRTAVRARRTLLHIAAGIRTRTTGMRRAVCASARVRFQAVGQRDADHGVEILSDLLAADSSAQAQPVCQAIMQWQIPCLGIGSAAVPSVAGRNIYSLCGCGAERDCAWQGAWVSLVGRTREVRDWLRDGGGAAVRGLIVRQGCKADADADGDPGATDLLLMWGVGSPSLCWY
jgi:hypothetical protein